MHAVEALISAADVTGEDIWLDRALGISERMIHDFARPNNYRVYEHFDEHWTPLPDYNRDNPSQPFRAFGSTPGHWSEWARLLLHIRAGLMARGRTAPGWLLEDAESLFNAMIRDAWTVDGNSGIVYSVDWDGKPVVRSRLRWSITESIAASAALEAATGKDVYAEWYERFWDWARDHLMDYQNGSWWHELSLENKPSSDVWSGKPDIYHLLNALVVTRAPLAPALAPALASGLLDVRRPIL